MSCAKKYFDDGEIQLEFFWYKNAARYGRAGVMEWATSRISGVRVDDC